MLISTATDTKIVNNSFGAVKVNSVPSSCTGLESFAAFGVRIVNSDLGMDDTKETPYSYPALKDHMDLASGAGALVNTNECHIQIADNGIYSMSDGKIGAYLNTDAHASSDALGTYTDDVVKSGTIDELGKKAISL